jgi:hypothetical protein
MRVPTFLNCIAIFFALTVPTFLQAQISEADRNTAIQTIAKHIAENYVFQDKGGQISSHILMANHKGEFNKASNWDEFNTMVTKSLQKFSGDHHLYVKRDPSIVKELKTPGSKEDQMNVGPDNTGAENYGISESKIVDDNIGYLKLTGIDISKKSLPLLYEAMRKVENSDALIIDLRDNKGGGSEIGSVLESYFLPENTPLLEFMSRQGTQTIDSTVNWLEEKKYSKPVYILTNKNTASAAEAFAFVMQKKKRAKVIGETSSGAANRNDWYIVNDENYISVSTAATYLPGTQITWEQVGVKPDIKVKNGDALEYTLNNVLKS